MEQDIFDMGLHQMIKIQENLFVLRVSGGWIYAWGEPGFEQTTFVPFDNELQDWRKDIK
jgi:hypothetical protein